MENNNETERNVYQEKGFKDREEYLESIGEDYDIPAGFIEAMSDVLGESEDFDGLLSSMEDYESMFGGNE